MPNPRKPARLYLKRSKGREAKWIILDNNQHHATGCGEYALEEANQALAAYIQETYRPNTGQRSLSEIRCEDVIGLYASEIAPSLASAATIGYQGTWLSIPVERAQAKFDALSPEQKLAHNEAQRRSWVIGEMMLEHPEMTRETAESLYAKAISP